ncbi:hypothetical protein SCYAM73S_07862 [Streptomyces cyaneofuscatus]
MERPQETEESKLRTQEDETAPKTFDNLHGCLNKIVDEGPYGDEWTELLAPKPGCTGWRLRTSCSRDAVPGGAQLSRTGLFCKDVAEMTAVRTR